MAGKPWYTNGIDEIQLYDTEPIPNGYHKGRRPKTKEQQQEIIKKYQNTMKSKSQDELDSINLKRSQTLSKTYSIKSEEEKQSIINKRRETKLNLKICLLK